MVQQGDFGKCWQIDLEQAGRYNMCRGVAMAGGQLDNAKRQKADEFYTQLSDIEKELRNYKEQFEGKTVFCNCDDPEWSNFYYYFVSNFEELKLKKLITTHFEIDKPSYKIEYTGGTNAKGDKETVVKRAIKSSKKTALKQNYAQSWGGGGAYLTPNPNAPTAAISDRLNV